MSARWCEHWNENVVRGRDDRPQETNWNRTSCRTKCWDSQLKIETGVIPVEKNAETVSRMKNWGHSSRRKNAETVSRMKNWGHSSRKKECAETVSQMTTGIDQWGLNCWDSQPRVWRTGIIPVEIVMKNKMLTTSAWRRRLNMKRKFFWRRMRKWEREQNKTRCWWRQLRERSESAQPSTKNENSRETRLEKATTKRNFSQFQKYVVSREI